MRSTDTIRLLRDLDPAGTHAARRQPSSRRARAPRLVAVALATAAILAAGLSTAIDDPRAPGFLEQARAALTASDRILHLRFRGEFHFPADAPNTAELWTRGGGRQLRLVYDGGKNEFVRDTDERYAAGYTRARNVVAVYTDPGMWQVRADEELNFSGPQGAARIAESLAALLERARNGDPAVRRLADADLDGRPAARLETTMTIQAADEAPADGSPPDLRPVAIRTLVWFDLETHLPRRIERFHGDRRASTVEILLAERLDAGAGSDALLEMPAHPGATRVVASGR